MASPSRPFIEAQQHHPGPDDVVVRPSGDDQDLDINEYCAEYGLARAHETVYVVEFEKARSSNLEQSEVVDLSDLRQEILERIRSDPTQSHTGKQWRVEKAAPSDRHESLSLSGAPASDRIDSSGSNSTATKGVKLSAALVALVEMALDIKPPRSESDQVKEPSPPFVTKDDRIKRTNKHDDNILSKFEAPAIEKKSIDATEAMETEKSGNPEKKMTFDEWLEVLAKEDECPGSGENIEFSPETSDRRRKVVDRQPLPQRAPKRMADKMRFFAKTAPRKIVREACRRAAAAIDQLGLMAYMTRDYSILGNIDRFGKFLTLDAWNYLQRHAEKKGNRKRKEKSLNKPLFNNQEKQTRSKIKDLRRKKNAEAQAVAIERLAKRPSRMKSIIKQASTSAKGSEVMCDVQPSSMCEKSDTSPDQPVIGRLIPPDARSHDVAIGKDGAERPEWQQQHLDMCRLRGGERIALEAYCIKSAHQQIATTWNPREAIELSDGNRLIGLSGPGAESVRSLLGENSYASVIAPWIAEPAQQRKALLGGKGRLKNDGFHLIWSFPRDFLAAARSGGLDMNFLSCFLRLVARLDLNDHRCVCILHVDSDGGNPHLHIIGSRVREDDASLWTIPGYMRKPALWLHGRVESAVYSDGSYSKDDIDVLGGLSRAAMKGECKMHLGTLVALRHMLNGSTKPVSLQSYDAICRMERAAPSLGLIGGVLLYGLGGSRHHFSTAEMRADSNHQCDAVLSLLEYLLRSVG
jgi:hypothetical protein